MKRTHIFKHAVPTAYKSNAKNVCALWVALMIVCLARISVTAQPLKLTLEEVVNMAREQSIASRQAATLKKTNYWKYRSFLADFKPQLSLNGSLPGFTRSFVQVQQPDGTVVFQPVSNNNSLLNLALSQNIPFTGGSVYVQQQLQRFDNFLNRNTLYNGIPVAIGLSQPLFRFNQMKWDRRTEPLRYAESNQQYVESMEQIAVDATSLFFDLLVSQVNLQIAETNRANNDTLYTIAQHKLALGKLSRNDLLQLQLSVLNARKDLASARQTAEVASLKLRTLMNAPDIGSGQPGTNSSGNSRQRPLDLVIPSQVSEFSVDIERAIAEAFANRSDAIAFQRKRLEADRDVERARMSSTNTQPGSVFRADAYRGAARRCLRPAGMCGLSTMLLWHCSTSRRSAPSICRHMDTPTLCPLRCRCSGGVFS